MRLLEENIIRKEYDEVSNDIYSALLTSAQLIDEYSELLRHALLKKVFTTLSVHIGIKASRPSDAKSWP
jgi:hypothetical protein